MKLSELPEKPPPNGDAIQSWLVEAVHSIAEEQARPRPWYVRQITLGNLVTIGGIFIALLFAYFRGEAHLADQYHVHWMQSQLDEEIAKQATAIIQPTLGRLDRIEAKVDQGNARLLFFRSGDDTEWQRTKDRILVLEQHDQMRWKGQR